MPVYGTPVFGNAPSGQTTCSSLGTIRPKTPELYGCPNPTQTRVITATQANQRNLAWTVTDSDGNAVDLSSCGAWPTPAEPIPGVDVAGEIDPEVDYSQVKLRFVESVVRPPGDQTSCITITGSVTDASAGEVTFALPSTITNVPGVYFCEAAVFTSSGVLLYSQQFQFLVERGLFGPTSVIGPPTIAEIRLHLRDSHASENALLQNVQFTDAEILHAIEYPVLYWNESQPPISMNFNTSTYPFRFQWLEGTVAWLYRVAAHWYRRNQLAYQAGGVTINDLNKADEYQKMSDVLWERYTSWVKMKKMQYNAESCFQGPLRGYPMWNGPMGGSGMWGW